MFEKRDGEFVPANYTILKKEIKNDKAIITTALYQIPSGGINTVMVGEKKHCFRRNINGNLQRYAVSKIIY